MVLRDPLLPSLLDRLSGEGDGPAVRFGFSQDELIRSVLRDLAWLLNTTRLDAVQSLEGLPETSRSVLNFGLDSLAGRMVGDVAESEVADSVERAIRTFEPRLRGVRVRATKKLSGSRESIALRIDAQLVVRPLRDVHIRGLLDLDRSEILLTQSDGSE